MSDIDLIPEDRRQQTPRRRRGDSARWSVATKLWLAFGVLMAVFAGGGIVSHQVIQQIGRDVFQLAEVAKPLEEAVLEMEINAGESARAVLDYVRDLEPEHLEALRDSEADFAHFAAIFDLLAETDEERRLGQEVAGIYGKFKALGYEIVAHADRRAAILQRFRDQAARLKALIEADLTQSVRMTAPDGMKKLHAGLRMDAAVDGIVAATSSYVVERDPEFRQAVRDKKAAFKGTFAVYRSANLTSDEDELLDRIEETFSKFDRASEEAMALTDTLDARLAELVAGLKAFDAILDDEIQPLIHAETAKAAQNARTSSERAAVLLLVLGAIALPVGLVSAWALSRAIVGPVGELARGAEMVGAGQLSHRIEIRSKDEFGYLAAAFNRMVENLARAQSDLADGQGRLQSVLDTAADGILTFGQDGAITSLNKTAEAMFGYPADEAVGKNVKMLIPADEGDPANYGHAEVQGIVGREVVGRRRDGTEFPMDLAVSEFSVGSETAFTGIVRDITVRRQAQAVLQDAHATLERRVKERTADLKRELIERVRAEAALQENEARFRDFAESASDWFWEMDEDLRFTRFTGRIGEVTGFEPAEIIGKKHQELTGKDTDDPQWQEHVADLEAHRPFHNYQYTLHRHDGATIHIAISGKPIFAGGGEFIGYRGTGADVTERVQAEAALRESEHHLQTRLADLEEAHQKLERQSADLVRLAGDLGLARDQAEAANEAKSVFLAHMSHELRTPLNAIIGFSDLIMGETFGPVGSAKYVDYLKDINASGLHLLALINDILDLSKVESGMDELHEEDIEIAGLVRSVHALVKGWAEGQSPALEFIVAEDLPPLRADRRKLLQILVNLMSNAIKFTEAGGRVTLRAWCDGGHGFEVVDTGIGIAAGEISKALSQFGQVGAVVDQQYEGTGLGLPLSKALTELHDGSLDLKSEVGVGTTVTVRFPATRVAATEARAPCEPARNVAVS